MKPRELEEERREYQEALARALEDIVAILKEIPEVKRIFLFGSYA
ncbi:nucleotidyltransferase domain-containing protein, partial [Candidatus Acetothermia bacterium]